MRIIRSLPALIAAFSFAALPLSSPAQLSVGIGFTVGAPPPPIPYYEPPPAPYPNYQWTPGYWGWGSAGYYWTPGVWVAPPAIGLYYTPGYWGYGGGGYGWNNGYWGATVGFYGGVNYGGGYYGSGFYGGQWGPRGFAYNTSVYRVNNSIHNTYINKTYINNHNVYNNSHTSYNGGHGGIAAKPTSTQIEARKSGRAPTPDQRNQARIAANDRNLYANVNKGKPPITTSTKPFNENNKPPNAAPVTAADKQSAQKLVKNPGTAPTTQNKPANSMQNNKAPTTQQHKPAATTQQHKPAATTQQHKPAPQGGKPPSGQGKPPQGSTQGKPPGNNGNNGKPPRG
jgi:hypothetical protein